jgi:hypothetical protein
VLRPFSSTCSDVIASSAICFAFTALSLSRLPRIDLPLICFEPTAPRSICFDLTAPLAIALPVTAPLAMSFFFTEFLPGRAIAAPDIAATSAASATTSAGEGRSFESLLTDSSLP